MSNQPDHPGTAHPDMDRVQAQAQAAFDEATGAKPPRSYVADGDSIVERRDYPGTMRMTVPVADPNISELHILFSAADAAAVLTAWQNVMGDPS